MSWCVTPNSSGGSLCNLFRASSVNGFMGWTSMNIGMVITSSRLNGRYSSSASRRGRKGVRFKPFRSVGSSLRLHYRRDMKHKRGFRGQCRTPSAFSLKFLESRLNDRTSHGVFDETLSSVYPSWIRRYLYFTGLCGCVSIVRVKISGLE